MKAICPNCSQITLGYDEGDLATCPICGMVYEAKLSSQEEYLENISSE